MSERPLDVKASSFTIRTRAEGVLSKLAHDLELAAENVTAEIDVEGEQWKAALVFSVDAIDVVGTLRGDQVDRGGLNRIERMEIKRRIRKEVLPVPTVRVVAEGPSHREGVVTIMGPRGEQRVPLQRLDVEERPGGGLVVKGRTFASLRQLGVKEVKGPMGAFKVSDTIELAFYAMLGASP